jgi:hypothetical protein
LPPAASASARTISTKSELAGSDRPGPAPRFARSNPGELRTQVLHAACQFEKREPSFDDALGSALAGARIRGATSHRQSRGLRSLAEIAPGSQSSGRGCFLLRPDPYSLGDTGGLSGLWLLSLRGSLEGTLKGSLMATLKLTLKGRRFFLFFLGLSAHPALAEIRGSAMLFIIADHASREDYAIIIAAENALGLELGQGRCTLIDGAPAWIASARSLGGLPLIRRNP